MSERQSIEQLISLRGRWALVTGASAGIGKAIAYRLAEAGAKLEIVDIDEEGLISVKQAVEKLGVEVRSHVVDLAKKEEIDRLWDSLEGVGPDILVNNAGVYPLREFLTVDEKFYQAVVRTNLESVYWMCQKMVKRRLKRGGVIVNVGSIEAILPFQDGLAHYSMSKAGVIALTRALAKEYGKQGFRANVVVPGGIVTQGTKEIAKGIFRFQFGLIKAGMEFKRRLPMGRAGQADEVARMVLVLASDLASYVQGAVIPVDGGFLST